MDWMAMDLRAWNYDDKAQEGIVDGDGWDCDNRCRYAIGSFKLTGFKRVGMTEGCWMLDM
jgi:hypothetical protein